MRVVLKAMVDAGYLTAKEAEAVRAPALDIRTASDLPTGTYFADWALPQARALEENSYSKQTYTTTLDARLQAAARRAIARAALGKAQVALVAMRPDGEVVAMVGGKDYAKTPFNRATQARRQPGSTFQAFRLSGCARRRLETGRHHREYPVSDRQLPSRELGRPLFADHYAGKCLRAFEQCRGGAPVRQSG